MTDNTKEKKPWERQKNEPSSSYALFNEYILIGPLRTIPKLREKVMNNEKFDTTPSLSSLENKSSKWRWPERASAYDTFQIEEKRAKIEARASQRLIARLDKSEEIEDKINDEMIKILGLPDGSIEPSKRAYAMKMLSDAKKVELDSQRLDLGEPTIIQKSDVKADIKNDNPVVKEVNDLFDEAERGNETK